MPEDTVRAAPLVIGWPWRRMAVAGGAWLLLLAVTLSLRPHNYLFHLAGVALLATGIGVAALVGRGVPAACELWVPRHERVMVVSLVGLVTAVFCGCYGLLALVRYARLMTGLEDLGLFHYLLARLLEGQWFALPGGKSFLAQHTSFLLPLLLPFQLLWDDPRVLQVLQVAALAGAAVPVYLIGRARCGSRYAGAGLACLYLFLPWHADIALYDFHPSSFIALPALLAWYCWLRDRRGWAVILGVAALCVQESAALVLCCLLLLLPDLGKQKRAVGLGLFVCLAWLVLALTVVMPAFGGPERTDRYTWLGRSLGEIAANVLTRPGALLAHFDFASRLGTLSLLAVAVGLLPLLCWRGAWLVLPVAGLHLLSSFEPQYDLRWHYAAEVLPVLIVAATAGAQQLDPVQKGFDPRCSGI